MTAAASACVTGGNPELHVRVPDLTGFPKDEVVIASHSRNQYDQAVRSVGLRVVEAKDAAEFEAALGPRVALIYVFAGPRVENGSPGYDQIYSLARKRNIPVLVDAAAETLNVPNVHLQRGATLVAYSGGKCLRGPQCAGLLLGRKDLVKAAWMANAPHHGHARSLKVGKEEAMGMLAAVEMWMKRDHQAEWNTWMSWMKTIADRVSSVNGVTTQIRETRELSNHCPTLSINWDPSKLGITGRELAEALSKGEPRIALSGGGRPGGGGNQTGISITSYMMKPGEDKIVGERIRQVLAQARAPKPPEPAPSADLAGRWDVHIEFAAGSADHVMQVRQQDRTITGTYVGSLAARDLTGTIAGREVRLTTGAADNHGGAYSFRFSGQIDGETMSGTLDMGEYLAASWSARRRSQG
jgi:L-seryl-tRNA(Ser) seleniumtransferase